METSELEPRLEEFPEDWERALAVVAHPDDLEYGAAGAIARWTSEGRMVAYVLVTRGEAGIEGMPPETVGPARVAEEVAGAAIVGVEAVEFLDGYADGLVEYGVPLRRDVAAAIRLHRPEVLLSMFRGAGGEPWNGARLAAFNGSPEPTHAVDVTGFLDRGIASLREHWLYLEGLGNEMADPDAFLRPAAESIGARQGVEHAVAFEVVPL